MHNPHTAKKETISKEDDFYFSFSQPGPKISLSSPVVDFGCVEEGEERVHQLELINSSPAEAVYQWDLDYNAHSVFNIHPACGIVRPHSQTSLKAVYRPTQPAAHHRRVPCLILRMVGGSMEITAHIFKSLHLCNLPLRSPCSSPCLVPVTQSPHSHHNR